MDIIRITMLARQSHLQRSQAPPLVNADVLRKGALAHEPSLFWRMQSTSSSDAAAFPQTQLRQPVIASALPAASALIISAATAATRNTKDDSNRLVSATSASMIPPSLVPNSEGDSGGGGGSAQPQDCVQGFGHSPIASSNLLRPIGAWYPSSLISVFGSA
ncbi:hypothetical protein BASA50_002405 [Batrachochytrium salamandrivorans]|uniref:Uncharacterized protein n=1 Tax=Batrachochytrium salamandrivorans TaxID=1357716 RepID=A0ABQ8FPA7_9FUNG|nr:hypothetical protein BASA62_002510 [Batrachochytrium salamandrivorans]KAH6579325.1 hypothetical protein BASA60_003325 [Batrachochytrium salamandrivorans]KAH6599902.1 hypothetical protein BASA61_002435 [Batrachochytrium salamandrivorans]KAH6600282.1 hypothetical protein BASA50_002405 [Batrachochytrium salamandrivorans]KAH9249333.1 hypothetical protein BASA81_012951 [Batrachochytrium salamandrivorans]